MGFDNLPDSGEEVSFAGLTGTVAKITKIAGGLEVIVQVNDEDDETPVSGAYGGFNIADTEADVAKQEKEDAKAEKADANKSEEKESGTKPAPLTTKNSPAVSKSATTNK